jgi:hypothetical protein
MAAHVIAQQFLPGPVITEFPGPELFGLGLLRRLLWAGVCSLFQLIGLALCIIDFCTLFCHAYSLPQRGEPG